MSKSDIGSHTCSFFYINFALINLTHMEYVIFIRLKNTKKMRKWILVDIFKLKKKRNYELFLK